MLRLTTDGGDFEATNDNADPNVLNMAGFNTTTSKLAQHFAYWRALKAEADLRGETVRFIGSIWTPPAWMKTNNSTINGGTLRTTMYAEYAEYLIAFITAVKQNCNIDLYAVSPQNEPAFVETYESCVYTAAEYRDMIKAVGPIVHAAFPDVKFFGAEDMLARWTTAGAFPGPLMADADSRAQVHALAVHGYSDGVHPTPTSQAATLWNQASRNCTSVGKPVWMTETSGFGSDWAGTLQLGEAIFAALKYGKASAWVWWTIAQEASDREGYRLMVNNVPNAKYYVSKQYYRYIRPGAEGIGCTSDDAEVLGCAFRHSANHTLTLVLLNTSTSAKTITLTGNGLPQFAAYRSSATQNCVDAGTVSGSTSLPGQSITTLYGTGYSPVVGVRPAAAQGAAIGFGAARHGTMFLLDGRAAAAGAVAASGIVLEQVTGARLTVRAAGAASRP